MASSFATMTRRTLLRLSPALHIARVTWAFSAVANAWLVVLWTRAVPQEPASTALGEQHLSVLLLASAGLSLGLFCFGTAINDIVDARRDRFLHPQRPIASGSATSNLGLAILTLSLLVAILSSLVFGPASVVLTALIAAGILLFNLTLRFIPALGLLTLALIHAVHMLVPNMKLVFVWPLLLVFTHVTAVAWIQHLVANKLPSISKRAMAFTVLGWTIVGIGIVGLFTYRAEELANDTFFLPAWVNPLAIVFPMLLAAAFPIFVIRKIKQHGYTKRAAEKIGRYGSIWMSLYGCACLLGQGAYKPALILGSLTLAGLMGMTVLRELYGFLEQPVGFRR
ncbi:MAG: hypothetical protein H6815_10355 [Phycisphaeraceae bacterium]|nr:hypothetical protein [Phycisphaerales bacterium]MCB9860841.1 hypothetical protein [Phycisphaeraceae bacterium]